jgi:hypothetical protein
MTPQELVGVWALMGQTWGAKFLEQYGDRPNTAWSSALLPLSLDAAKHSFTRLLQDGSGFAPTLPEFVKHASQYRPESYIKALPSASSRRWQDIQADASDAVTQFRTYGQYENWRASQKNKPAHPTPDSADWLYLHHLALTQAYEQNQRIGKAEF